MDNLSVFEGRPSSTQVKYHPSFIGLLVLTHISLGTTLSLIPESDAERIHEKIPGAKIDDSGEFYTIPCNTKTVVSFTFGGRSFDIDPKDLSFVQSNPNNRGECLSGLKPTNKFPRGEWLVRLLSFLFSKRTDFCFCCLAWGCFFEERLLLN